MPDLIKPLKMFFISNIVSDISILALSMITIGIMKLRIIDSFMTDIRTYFTAVLSVT
jgi:hypothetical protein